MTKSSLTAAALVLTLGAGAGARAQPSMSTVTHDYVTAASQSDMFEIQEGRMAVAMGASPAVRRFGAQMVRDHTMTTDNLHKALMSAGMPVPPPPPLRPDQQAQLASLQGASGMAFDMMYVAQQIPAHTEAAGVQGAYSYGGDVPALRQAAQMTVPVVQQHLDMLDHMQSAMAH